MHDHADPVDVAIAFTEAWTSHDMTTAAGYVAEDVVFEGPMTQSAGIDPFMDGLGRFADSVTGLEVLTALGTDERAMIMYDLTTGPLGMLRAAEELVISEGKITRDTLVFDTHKVRSAQGASAPAG